MNLNDVIFIDSLPSIDLHGLDRDTARVKILDFINDSIKLSNEVITIVHGNGEGILKKATQETLKKHKNVIDFKSYYYNTGMTIVKLKI